MKIRCCVILYFADVAELADALDLGSSVPDVQVQVLLSALKSITHKIKVLYFFY